MANTNSIGLVLASTQYLSRLDTGLSAGFPGKVSTGGAGDLSGGVWLNVTQLPSTAAKTFELLSKTDATNSSFSFRINSNDDLIFAFKDGSGNASQTISTSAVLVGGDVGNWVHFAFDAVVASGVLGITLYKDGSPIADTDGADLATSVGLFSAAFTVGAKDNAVLPNLVDGLMDEPMIFSEAKGSTWWADNYNRQTLLTSTNIEGHWHLDNDLLDVSGNSNTLTNNGTATFSSSVPFVNDPAAPGTITLTDIDVDIFQQDSAGQYDVPVVGTYTGTPTAIQARVVENGTTTEVKTWTTVDASPAGGTFSTTLDGVPNHGTMLNLEVRFSNDTGVTDEGTFAWGIGDLFLHIGQSNEWKMFTVIDSPPAASAITRMHTSAGWATVAGNGARTFANTLATNLGYPIGLLDYTISGSALLEEADSSQGWWLETGVATIYQDMLDGVSAATNGDNIIAAVSWGQGEREISAGLTTQSEYYNGLVTFLDSRIRTVISPPTGTLPILFSIAGRRTDAADANAQAIIDGMLQWLNGDSTSYRITTTDIPLIDTVHYTTAGYETKADRLSQAYLFFTGDEIFYRGAQATILTKVSSTQVDITLAYVDSGGTDFTPTTAITDFDLLDDGSAETITAAIRQDANTIRLTTSGSLDGVITARYNYGANPTITGVVLDNSSLTLPLEQNPLISELSGDSSNFFFLFN